MVAECLKQVNNLSRPILLCGEFSRRLSEGQLTLKSFFLVIPRSVEPGFTQLTRKAIVNRRNAIGLASSSGWLALAIHSRQRESSCIHCHCQVAWTLNQYYLSVRLIALLRSKYKDCRVENGIRIDSVFIYRPLPA